MSDTAEQLLREVFEQPVINMSNDLSKRIKEYFKAKDMETKALRVAMRQVFEGVDPGKEQELYDYLTGDVVDPDGCISDFLHDGVFTYPLFDKLAVSDVVSIVDDNMRLILEEFNNA